MSERAFSQISTSESVLCVDWRPKRIQTCAFTNVNYSCGRGSNIFNEQRKTCSYVSLYATSLVTDKYTNFTPKQKKKKSA